MIDAGQVTTEVGIAPVKPAEFVVFKISQYTAARPRRLNAIDRRTDHGSNRAG